MQDVIMEWKGNETLEAVHGVDKAEIPQFTVMDYRTLSTIEVLATGKFNYAHIIPPPTPFIMFNKNICIAIFNDRVV